MKKLIFTALFGLMLSVSAVAQTKVAYCNLDFVLVRYPAYQNVLTSLNEERSKIETYQQVSLGQLAELEQQAVAAIDAGGTGEAEIAAYEDMRDVISTTIQKMEVELDQVTNTRLAPVLDVIEDAINKAREEGGYDMVINSTDGSGVSIVLSGDEEHNLTDAVLLNLGIDTSAGQSSEE
jgi:Skp family chaperone for outer membrane proteins